MLQKDVWLWCSSVCSHVSPLMAFTCWKPYPRPFFWGNFWLYWYCVYITHLPHHLGRQRSLIARHLCLYVKGHVSLGICVWLTHGFEGGVFVESSCAVVALWVWKPLSKWTEGCVVQVVLFWWGRIRKSGICDGGYTSYVGSKSDAVYLFHQWWCGCHLAPTNSSILVSTLPPSWLDWDLSPGAMCAPAVQSITGLKWPRGTWGWGSKAPDSEYENLFLICDWLFWVIVGLRADE